MHPEWCSCACFQYNLEKKTEKAIRNTEYFSNFVLSENTDNHLQYIRYLLILGYLRKFIRYEKHL